MRLFLRRLRDGCLRHSTGLGCGVRDRATVQRRHADAGERDRARQRASEEKALSEVIGFLAGREVDAERVPLGVVVIQLDHDRRRRAEAVALGLGLGPDRKLHGRLAASALEGGADELLVAGIAKHDRPAGQAASRQLDVEAGIRWVAHARVSLLIGAPRR